MKKHEHARGGSRTRTNHLQNRVRMRVSVKLGAHRSPRWTRVRTLELGSQDVAMVGRGRGLRIDSLRSPQRITGKGFKVSDAEMPDRRSPQAGAAVSAKCEVMQLVFRKCWSCLKGPVGFGGLGGLGAVHCAQSYAGCIAQA